MLNVTVKALSKIETLSRQAERFNAQGQSGQAIVLLNSALETFRGTGHLDETVKANILDELGNSYFCQGDFIQAKDYYEQALKILQDRWYSEHACLVPVLDHLAQLYVAEGNFQAAEPVCRRSLLIKEKTLLPGNWHIIESMRMLAIVEGELGNFSQAETLLKKGISLLEHSTIGPFEEFVYALAKVYQKQGKSEEAEALYKQAILTFFRRSGRQRRLAHCLYDYAEFLDKQGRQDEAKKLQERAGVLAKHPGTIEEDSSLPNSPSYQKLVYPVTIFQ